MINVKLYYPNVLHSRLKELGIESKFNWFMCSKYYRDHKSGLYVAEIIRGTKFYESATGHTFAIPLKKERKELGLNTKDKETSIIVLVADAPNNLEIFEKSSGGPTSRAQFLSSIIKKYDYAGYAFSSTCESYNPFLPVVCNEMEFWFLPNILTISKIEEKCAIIEYSKRNWKCISKKIPNFPSPQNIDEDIKKYGCCQVCKKLHTLLNFVEPPKK